jgi:predicted Fe-S protein YdhL (DUF1289 family)
MAVLAATLCVPAANLFAQKNRPPRVERPAARPPAARPNAPARENLPPRWVERLREMTPAEQEKFLNNNARFRGLPAEQQAQIRQRLQNWNNLSPEQRQTLMQRERVLEEMTPEQRRYVRETLMPQWQSLPPARRQVVLGKLRDLHDLNDSERDAKLNDESFMNGLAPNERQLLRDLSSLRVGTPPG